MAGASKSSDINEEVVRKLARLLDETGLSEIEYGRDGWHVRVAKGPDRTAAAPAAPPASEPAPRAHGGETPVPAGHPGLVTAPMVGVVYTAAEEGAPPFVMVGDEVKAGDTLLLIEAMKVFNPIQAPIAGRVAHVLVRNATPVEYGEPLLVIE
jgi:acetyl-CoA carboxylase biotin carboxyl carrier protein